MFAQVIQAKAKDRDALLQRLDAWKQELMPGAEGFLGSTGGISPDGEFIMMARFESEEAASRNSDRPEQGEWWSGTEDLLEEPRFYNCTEIELWGPGGSDEAGFVQVVQGRVDASDRAKMRGLGKTFEELMPKARPDIVGGVAAWEGDSFSDFTYFSSEADAREGEKKEMPPDLQEAFATWQGLIEDVKFIDLPEPIFLTR